VLDSAAIVKSLTRCWRSFSHEYSAIYGLEEEEINRYAKQRVCIANDSINMYYGVVYEPRYKFKRVNAENYAKSNFDCSKRKLGILADSVYEVTVTSVAKAPKSGKMHKMTDVIAFDGICIYMVVDGVIFKMLDADAKARPASSN
jgi:hypothetical protein